MRRARLRIPAGALRVTVVGIAAVALLLWLRGDALLTPTVFNPDEAELLADGKRAMLSLVPYRDYTTPTFLFGWPMVLALLGKLGFALTLPTAHFLSGVSYLYLVLAGWYTLSRYVHWRFALACITPAALVLFSAHIWVDTDSLSLSTELLPIVLLTGAIHLVHTGDPLRWRVRLALAAVLAGASVEAKPQAFPLAIGVLAACIAAVSAQQGFATGDVDQVGRQTVRSVTTLAASFFLLPWAGAVVWMAAEHTLRAFLDEPLSFQIDYLFHRARAQPGSIAPSLGMRLTAIGDALTAIPLAFVVLVGAGDTRSGSVVFSDGWPRGRRRGALAVLVGVTSLAIISTVTPYPVYPHYLNFVFAGCIFATVSSCAMLGPRSPRQVTTRYEGFSPRALVVVPAIALSVLLVASTAFGGAKHGNLRWGSLFHSSQAFPPEMGPGWDAIRASCPPGAKVLVWGWSPEWYSYNDWVPASRYVDPWVFVPLSNHELYVRRTTQELTADPPACLLEAIGPAYFGRIGADRTIATTLPGAADLLTRCYDKHNVELPPGVPLTFYVRRGACAPHGR